MDFAQSSLGVVRNANNDFGVVVLVITHSQYVYKSGLVKRLLRLKCLRLYESVMMAENYE